MPEDAIVRPRLLARLNRMAALSLVVAPAGYGKTTLVGTWLMQTDVRHAWLSLDAGDNDPAVFLAAVTRALATIAPEFGTDILDALDSPQAGIFADLAVLLINQLNELTDDFILVLDDYHVIHTPAIHQLLIDLVTYPPRAMHLVLTSRHDPPLPWRVRTRSNLCELRAADLGFTDEEGAQFLTKATERPVGPADAHTLVQKSQGWITSLRLMALAQRLHAPNTPIPEMTSARAFGDYFNQEVLADLPAELLSFLVRTSILDLLSGPLCDFVAGTGDANAQQAGPVPGGGQC